MQWQVTTPHPPFPSNVGLPETSHVRHPRFQAETSLSGHARIADIEAICQQAVMISGIVVLIGIFLASLWSAILISRRKNAIFGIIGGFIVGAISWLTASMIFYYLGS
jgi:uncharacterized membrane protein YdjX (TVP38/TMEM64 family)